MLKTIGFVTMFWCIVYAVLLYYLLPPVVQVIVGIATVLDAIAKWLLI